MGDVAATVPTVTADGYSTGVCGTWPCLSGPQGRPGADTRTRGRGSLKKPFARLREAPRAGLSLATTARARLDLQPAALSGPCPGLREPFARASWPRWTGTAGTDPGRANGLTRTTRSVKRNGTASALVSAAPGLTLVLRVRFRAALGGARAVRRPRRAGPASRQLRGGLRFLRGAGGRRGRLGWFGRLQACGGGARRESSRTVSAGAGRPAWGSTQQHPRSPAAAPAVRPPPVGPPPRNPRGPAGSPPQAEAPPQAVSLGVRSAAWAPGRPRPTPRREKSSCCWAGGHSRRLTPGAAAGALQVRGIRASEVPPGASTSSPTPGLAGPRDPWPWLAAGGGRREVSRPAPVALLRVAVGPEGRLLGSREAEAAHAGVGEAPAARPRRRDGEAHAAVRQPASVALVQPRELPGGVEVPDLGHRGPASPARRVRFGQSQPPGHEEHVACGAGRITTAAGVRGPGRAWRARGPRAPRAVSTASPGPLRPRACRSAPASPDRPHDPFRAAGAGSHPRPAGHLPPRALTCRHRSEAEGVVAVALPVAGPVAADPRPPPAAARGARREHRVAHRALEQPARVAPVQALGPRWRAGGDGVGG